MKTDMQVTELTTTEYLSHLRRHPIPEIMDDMNLKVLSVVEAQYGDIITHGAGLEVRLSEERRYTDYIMNIDQEAVPSVESLWYEIDYEEIAKAYTEGGRITPCLFANTRFKTEDKAAWDKFLPPFLGNDRAKKLRASFDHVIARLPEGAYIKQVGTMTARGELSIMRLVIMFHCWEEIAGGLAAIGWQGDTKALTDALEPWEEGDKVAVNIDLGEHGVLPKIGIEVFSRWRHPVLVDKFITRLEEAGLCLPSKGKALRRWIRILPDGDPFIQTLISYFKLNYRDGKITEAKAYLEQSPYIHHHYFEAYDRPVRLDMELTKKGDTLPPDDAVRRIRECPKNRVRHIRLYGTKQYEHLEHLLSEAKDSGIKTEIVLEESVEPGQLAKMYEAGNPSFLVEIKSSAEDDAGFKTLSGLQELKISPVKARWHMNAENAGDLCTLADRVKAYGVSELIITGMCAVGNGQPFPGLDDIKKAAEFIESYEGMTITVESCFSPLRAFMGGEDPKRNPNRGITLGCEAGRSFLSVRSDGKLTPCLMLEAEGDNTTIDTYWEQHDVYTSLGSTKKRRACSGCSYEQRCLPCPAAGNPKEFCPLCPNTQ